MADRVGKKFETKFRDDFLKIPNSTIDRLYDTTNGFKAITQVSDFIGYKKPNIFYLEVKTHAGNTFPFSCLSQYTKLLDKCGIEGVRVGVVLWLYDHDAVMYVPIASIKHMKEDGLKSINIKMYREENPKYKIVKIPSIKKKVFMDSDYSVLTELEDGD